MKKKILFLSILCLLFVTLSYTYSSFNNTIVGTITANVKDWVFKVSVNNGTIKDGGYNLHLSGTSGSFNININTNGSKSGADYTIELIGDSSIKFYTDSSYTNLINNNIYSGSIYSNTNSSVTIYYKSDTAINSDILIKTKGTIMEVATMKNGNRNGSGTEFWSEDYKPYIRTITFGNDLSNLPSTCNEENLCWDISKDPNQNKKVYGYLIDSGLTIEETDSSTSTTVNKPLYNLYIVSETQIFAPSSCYRIFSLRLFGNHKSNLISINFNNNFNTSNVTDMAGMFDGCPYLTSLDLSSFNTAKVTNMKGMFEECSSLTSLDLSSFNTSNVTDMSYMFSEFINSSLTSLDLSSFNTSNVTDMSYMFGGFINSSLTSLDLSSFNTAKVTNMKGMFYACRKLTSLDLSNFDTTKVKNMEDMFSDCSSLTSLDLSNFNTSNVTSMEDMFSYCSSLTSLDLSNFNTANVTNMRYMFNECSSLTSLDLSNFNTANIINMYGMFEKCSSLTTTINIMNSNVTDYKFMFYSAAAASGSKITVNYIASASTLVDNMIATKSSNSNVIKGSIIPEYSITITGNDDIKYESINRVKGTKVTLTSISGNYLITSFKMNETTINGNEFIMPDTDVTISDVATTPGAIYETDHYPYLQSHDNVILAEHTFEGAKSLTVILDYQTGLINYDYFLIYDSSSSTTGINDDKRYGGDTRTKETITINSNYIKITFTTYGFGGNDYYGLKAIVIPNY